MDGKSPRNHSQFLDNLSQRKLYITISPIRINTEGEGGLRRIEGLLI